MSVVAVKVNKNGFEMCADSQATDGQLPIERSKLYEYDGLIIGTSGYTEDMSLMQLFIRTSKPVDPTEFSILDFMSSFYDWIYKKTHKWSEEYNHWLIGMNGKVFCVTGWDVVEINDMYAIGCGDEIALTAMHLGHSAYDAVKIACKLNVYCGEPIIKFVQTIKKKGK
jgi:ATP-dependent protease HslVU (ClpYQ) peptidase subunit